MKKWISTGLILLLAATSSAWAGHSGDFKKARNLIENWFTAMSQQKYDKAGHYLASEFVSIHTDGIVRNKKQEIELIKNLDMKTYHLSDFKYSRSGDAIVVTYRDDGSEKIDNDNIGKGPAPRMAVVQKQGKKLLILAYANLDSIK